LEEFDDRLLVSVHPAGDGNKEELELSCHGVRNLSKVAAAQSSKEPRLPRLSFLVVQVIATKQRLFYEALRNRFRLRRLCPPNLRTCWFLA
jgi:hypothetical protein